MGREIVENDADDIGLRVVSVDEIAHAFGKVLRGALLGNLDRAPGPMGVEKDEEIDCPIAFIFAVIAFELSRLGRDRLTHFTDQLMRAFIEADDRSLGIMAFGVEVEHVLHPGDIVAIDLGNAPHVPTPGLEIVLFQAPAYGFTRQAVMLSQLDHFVGQ